MVKFKSTDSAPSAEVAGTGIYLPAEVISNGYFLDGKPWHVYDRDGKITSSKIFSSEEEIIATTGIRERRKSKSYQTAEYMAANAAMSALEDANLSAKDLDGIIVATISASRRFPSVANFLQNQIGAVNAKEPHDIAYACAGSCLGIKQAASEIINNGRGPYLVVGVEDLTRITDYVGRDINATLFGSGAGAVVIVPTHNEGKGVLAYHTGSDPFNGKLEYIFFDGNHIRMTAGSHVLKHAVIAMTNGAHTLNEELGWDKEGIYIPHQANLRIINGVKERAGLDDRQVYVNIHKYGNMSTATNPVALHEVMHDGTIKPGTKARLLSFGSGLVEAHIAIQF